MDYRIHSGDTLSRLASKFNTSVSALMKANPQIKNANLIYTGATLHIPGAHDTFEPSKPTKPGQTPPTKPGSTGAKDGSAAYKVGMSKLGQNASSLKLDSSTVGKDMDDWVSSKECCANFVSACLQASGEISKSQHSDLATGLMNNLDKDPNWKRTTLANAKPGDVVTFQVGATGHHSVMFAGWKDGKPMFLGSNNINSDGTQQVSVRNMNYKILGVQHYVG